MVRPQPDFEMGQGTVPVKDLEHKRKSKSSDMKIFNRLVPSARKRPEDQKQYPEKMDKNDGICKYPDEH
jgi:hypothetical protein